MRGTAVRGLSRCVLSAAVVLVAIAVAGCGSSSVRPSEVAIVQSGQLPRADLPSGVGHGKAGLAAGGTTVPLAKQNPTTALFSAIGVFQSCLAGMGVTFIGAPSPANPATNSPAYLKSLTTCAAKSNIIQALKAAQSAQDNLTLAQIKKENSDYLTWRKCMVARGWGIPEPRPNAKGLLFSFGGTSAPAFKAPPGQSLFSSPDVQQCAAKAQQGGS